MAFCLVTGATGYIGGRLAPRLVEAGHRVRCLRRSPNALRDVPWAAQTELVAGDAGNADDMRRALEGIDVAYYLVHSLGSPSFADTDRRAAATLATAARAAAGARLGYLCGPDPPDEHGSAHLPSRAAGGQNPSDAG